MAGDSGPNDIVIRPWLAIAIVSFSVIGIVVASVAAIALASAEGRSDATQLVFSSVLPLFGTWVGTVLAFYFARENLAAATASTVRLIGKPDERTLVSTEMIPRAQIVAHELAADQDATAVDLAELQRKMDASGKHRIPILKADGSAVYVVYQSVIAQLAAQASSNPRDAAFSKTVADLLLVPELKAAIEAIAFVADGELLSAARTQMSSVPGCRDVFVTKGGQRTEPIVGWLTDSDLARAS